MSFLNRLDIYTKIPLTTAMTEIIVKILVQLISTLAVATKQIKQGRLSESIFAHASLDSLEMKRNSERNSSGIMISRLCWIDWIG